MLHKSTVARLRSSALGPRGTPQYEVAEAGPHCCVGAAATTATCAATHSAVRPRPACCQAAGLGSLPLRAANASLSPLNRDRGGRRGAVPSRMAGLPGRAGQGVRKPCGADCAWNPQGVLESSLLSFIPTVGRHFETPPLADGRVSPHVLPEPEVACGGDQPASNPPARCPRRSAHAAAVAPAHPATPPHARVARHRVRRRAQIQRPASPGPNERECIACTLSRRTDQRGSDLATTPGAASSRRFGGGLGAWRATSDQGGRSAVRPAVELAVAGGRQPRPAPRHM